MQVKKYKNFTLGGLTVACRQLNVMSGRVKFNKGQLGPSQSFLQNLIGKFWSIAENILFYIHDILGPAWKIYILCISINGIFTV